MQMTAVLSGKDLHESLQETERQTGKQTERETDRQTDRETDRQKDRKRKRFLHCMFGCFAMFVLHVIIFLRCQLY